MDRTALRTLWDLSPSPGPANVGKAQPVTVTPSAHAGGRVVVDQQGTHHSEIILVTKQNMRCQFCNVVKMLAPGRKV